MTALDFDINFDPGAFDLGDHTSKQQILRQRNEQDDTFLARVTMCHGWQLGDQLELRADRGRLVAADISACVRPGAGVAALRQPTADLKSLAQILLFLQYGSVLLEETEHGLAPVEMRIAFRRKQNESLDAFETRIKRQSVALMNRRFPGLTSRRHTAIDDAGRATTHIVMTLR